MSANREKLLLLYLISIYQPVRVEELRRMFAKSSDVSDQFATVLNELRDQKLASGSDPVTCTPSGQIVLRAPKLRISRDINRMFYLKRSFRDGKSD